MAKLDPGQPVLVLAAGCGGIKELQETCGILDHPARQILARFFVCLPWWIYIKTWKKPSFNRKHRALNQNGFVFPIFSNVAPLLDKARCPQNQGVCPDVDELRFDAFW